MRTLLTLAFPVADGRVLLGMKKRGFGMGRWNGFGGKVESNETIEEGAIRETLEESGITPTTLELVGIHEFEFTSAFGNILEVHVYRITAWTGEPVETEEMRPRWYPTDAIPFGEMWPDDIYWMPLFLAGKKFRTKFLFGDGDTVLEKKVREVPALDKERKNR